MLLVVLLLSTSAMLPVKAAPNTATACATQPNDDTDLQCGRGANTSTASSDSFSTAVGTDAIASGDDATAIGAKTQATANQATALGQAAQATGVDTTAIGAGASASGSSGHSTALGTGANASGNYSTAIGEGSQAEGFNAMAVGRGSRALGLNSAAVGTSARADVNGATSLGVNARGEGIYSTAVGLYSEAESSNSIAIGPFTNATATGALAIGGDGTDNGATGAEATGLYTTAVGPDATAGDTGAAAIGNGSAASDYRSVAVGSRSIASGPNATAIGPTAEATSNNATSIGRGAIASGANAFAGGTVARAQGRRATALGIFSQADGVRSLALGDGAKAVHNFSAAIGFNAEAKSSSNIAIGNINASYTLAGLSGTGMRQVMVLDDGTLIASTPATANAMSRLSIDTASLATVKDVQSLSIKTSADQNETDSSVATQLAQLFAMVEAAAQERSALIQQVAELEQQLASSQSALQVSRHLPAQLSVATLEAAGMDTTTATEIFTLNEQSISNALALRHTAAREGWLISDRYNNERTRLLTTDNPVRLNLGDDGYAEYLQTTEQASRVIVNAVLVNSAASIAGIQSGDEITDYAGNRIFSTAELLMKSVSGQRDEVVPINVLRHGEPMQLFINRGPLGVHVIDAISGSAIKEFESTITTL